MKVFLVFLDMDSFHKDEYHFGLAHISSYLKKNNHQVGYMYFCSLGQTDDLISQVKAYSPDIVGFSAVETQFIYVDKLSRIIRENFSCFIICGGVYVTIFPEAIKEAPCLDGIIMGEAEIAFLKLIECIKENRDYRRTPNFCYFDREKGEVVKNDLLPLIRGLDSLPFPDRDILDYASYINCHGFISFLFNRGCPYKCTYCSNHALAKVYGLPKNYTRFRTVDSCLSEIEEILSRYGTNMPLYFLDDIFTFNLPWLYEFLDKYKKAFKKRPFICHTRPNLASKEMFRRLREAGCYRVLMSIESGNDFIRNKVMKRGISKEQLYNSFKWAHQYNLETNGVTIIGLPYETKETILETIKTVAETDTATIATNIFYPYRGTELFELCKKENLLKEEQLNKAIRERREAVLELPTITKEEIQYFYNNFEELVLRHKSPIWRVKNKIRRAISKCFKEKVAWKTIRDTKTVRYLRRLIKI